MQQDQTDPTVHTRPLGKASGLRKFWNEPAQMIALMAFAGAGVQEFLEQLGLARSVPRRLGSKHMTRRAFSSKAMLRE